MEKTGLLQAQAQPGVLEARDRQGKGGQPGQQLQQAQQARPVILDIPAHKATLAKLAKLAKTEMKVAVAVRNRNDCIDTYTLILIQTNTKN
jgi:hypothetical protein